jgi:N6-adenosine-specific RNA methylase IME4
VVVSDRFGTIVADPPWPIKWTGGTRKAGATAAADGAPCRSKAYVKNPLPYDTMGVDEIAALPVASVAADNAHVFLWTLDRFVLDGSAARIIRAWGFEPLPQMIVWRKKSPGLGRILRPAHELIAIGRRGHARFAEVALPTVREWRQPYENGAKQHSAKPDAALDEIEQMSDGPYLELFARRARLGWDYWGDEAMQTIELAT